jgi:SPP1 gp7 family putative phage head morphogenesis protein
VVNLNRTAKDLWKPKRRIEAMYKLFLKKAMEKLEKELANLENPRDILKAIRKFSNSMEFSDYAEALAGKMVTHVFTDAGRTWREAARENGKGRFIYEALKKELNGHIGGAVNEQIQRNAEIIKSLPLDISKQVTNHIAEESLKGKRASQIAEEIKEYMPHVTNAKASLIARTETSKTSTALTKARSENLGINWYVWRTSEDSRVRSSHNHMDDILINWNNPPSPEKLIGEKFVGYYHAGNIYNCRCYCEPLVTLNYIKWPHKVYYQNRIQMMSRKQFEAIM